MIIDTYMQPNTQVIYSSLPHKPTCKILPAVMQLQ